MQMQIQVQIQIQIQIQMQMQIQMQRRHNEIDITTFRHYSMTRRVKLQNLRVWYDTYNAGNIMRFLGINDLTGVLKGWSSIVCHTIVIANQGNDLSSMLSYISHNDQIKYPNGCAFYFMFGRSQRLFTIFVGSTFPSWIVPE